MAAFGRAARPFRKVPRIHPTKVGIVNDDAKTYFMKGGLSSSPSKSSTTASVPKAKKKMWTAALKGR